MTAEQQAEFELSLDQLKYSLVLQFLRKHDVLLLTFRQQEGSLLSLHVGYNLPLPITGLEVDQDGFHGTFAFNYTPVYIEVQWCQLAKLAVAVGMPPTGAFDIAVFPNRGPRESGAAATGPGPLERRLTLVPRGGGGADKGN